MTYRSLYRQLAGQSVSVHTQRSSLQASLNATLQFVSSIQLFLSSVFNQTFSGHELVIDSSELWANSKSHASLTRIGNDGSTVDVHVASIGYDIGCAAERAEKAEAAAGAVTVRLLGDSEGGVAVAGWRWHSDGEKGVLVGPVGGALGMATRGEERWLVMVLVADWKVVRQEWRQRRREAEGSAGSYWRGWWGWE
ncbi:hypothetical protein BDZ97DRAFT_1763361 [Flammula alnicola]|nr:hypothetical protein BDZ97DRAFT_1763361 [Flammula alnicola]